MIDLEDALASMRTAWLAGRPGLEAVPVAWRQAIRGDEIAALALAGHASEVLACPVPSTALQERALLPRLSMPVLPDAHRGRFRRLLESKRKDALLESALISFLLTRGYAAHPADWMPDARDDWAPEAYGPWLDWVRADVSRVAQDEIITTENYEQWSWQDRRRALAEMRMSDPVAARDIIAAKAATEPAERRLVLVGLLATGLSANDAQFLEGLAGDRSSRVQALATGLLGRLGHGAGNVVLAAELAASVELRNAGILSRRKRLCFVELKTRPQVLRRSELFRLVPLCDLSAALGVDEPSMLQCLPEGSATDLQDFVACVAMSGTEASIKSMIGLLMSDKSEVGGLLVPLVERLGDAARRELVASYSGRDSDLFATTFQLAGPALGQLPLKIASTSPSYLTIRSHVDALVKGPDKDLSAAENLLPAALLRLGLLLDGPGAAALLSYCVDRGVSPADPRLEMLEFNIALQREPST